MTISPSAVVMTAISLRLLLIGSLILVASLHRIRRDNLDACHLDTFGGLARFAALVGHHRSIGNLLQYVIPFDQFAEVGVLSIQGRRLSMADEKLASSTVRVLWAWWRARPLLRVPIPGH